MENVKSESCGVETGHMLVRLASKSYVMRVYCKQLVCQERVVSAVDRPWFQQNSTLCAALHPGRRRTPGRW